VNYVKNLCELCGKEKTLIFLTHRKLNRMKNYVNYMLRTLMSEWLKVAKKNHAHYKRHPLKLPLIILSQL